MGFATHTGISYPREPGTALAVRELSPPSPRQPRLLDRVREALRARHASRRTEKAYVAWIRRFILFHGKRHPAGMGAAETTQFLSSLAVQGNVAASTQNQALSALLFLYRHVLEQELPWLDGVVRAKRAERLPVVLTRDEVRAVIRELQGSPRLMAILLYGAGLRVLEWARLRVKDVDFATNQIVVRAGKGDKDRVTMLPDAVKADLARPACGVPPTGCLDYDRRGKSTGAKGRQRVADILGLRNTAPTGVARLPTSPWLKCLATSDPSDGERATLSGRAASPALSSSIH